MRRSNWLFWSAPLMAWGVYWCWLAGYQSGYEAGHHDGWGRSREMIQSTLANWSQSQGVDEGIRLTARPVTESPESIAR
jgi:hypothetical protein